LLSRLTRDARAKLAMYRQRLLEPGPTSGAVGDGFDVGKHGDARVALVGFPSVGKSTLLTEMTDTESNAAAYAFTTVTAIPGNIFYHGATIQMLDLPGIIEGAAYGKGRGRQVIAAAKTSDLILLMLDATKGDVQRHLLLEELQMCGIRVNRKPPNITITIKEKGGVAFNSTVPQSTLDAVMVRDILKDQKINNADINCHEDLSVDDFIDAIFMKNRKYVPCLFVYNKIDELVIEEVDRLAALPNSLVISSRKGWNLDILVEEIWRMLDLVRVYTKRRGEEPNLTEALVLSREHNTVLDVCRAVHKEFEKSFRMANVWGRSAKHSPQKVGLNHCMEDEDVIELIRN
jgi:small GTP-binding protein